MADKEAKKNPSTPATASAESGGRSMAQIQDVDVEVSVELGRSTITLDHALEMGEQSLMELNRHVGEPVDVRLNGRLFARGEVVTVSENFGVRLTEIIGQDGE